MAIFKNNFEAQYIFLIITLSVLMKWIVLVFFFDNYLYTNVLLGLHDTQYFPLVISFSNFELSPTYLNLIEDSKIISFPAFSILLHSLMFKFLGVYSLIFLELIFQLIFFFILFITIKNIFENQKTSLIFCLIIISSPFILEILNNFEISKLLSLTKDQLNDNFGNRFPRPLVTGIFYFLFFLIVFKIKDKFDFKFNFKYYLVISFILCFFLNSFFYYFINFTLLFLILFIKNNHGKYKLFFLGNKKKIFTLFFISLILISPFLIQLLLSESDYGKRLGLIEINYDKKLYLIKYFLQSLFRIEFLALIIPSLIIYKYSNYSCSLVKQVSKINIFFYNILISIISPIIFFIFSPFLISIYHFVDILIFACIFYIILGLYFIFISKFYFYKKIQNIKFYLFLFLILYCVSIFITKKNHFDKLEDTAYEINAVQNFLESKKIKNTSKKLFTNDLNVMNLWLFNSNSELVISDGFTNSLSNSEIEFNFINNLKDFQISESLFKKIISFNKSELSSRLIYFLFCYQYQANSLYTFSKIDNYTSNVRNMILNSSPFRAQLQIMPENEKQRLLKSYKEHIIDDSLLSDYVIINNSLLNEPLIILNSNYQEFRRSKNFIFYKRIN